MLEVAVFVVVEVNVPEVIVFVVSELVCVVVVFVLGTADARLDVAALAVDEVTEEVTVVDVPVCVVSVSDRVVSVLVVLTVVTDPVVPVLVVFEVLATEVAVVAGPLVTPIPEKTPPLPLPEMISLGTPPPPLPEMISTPASEVVASEVVVGGSVILAVELGGLCESAQPTKEDNACSRA